MQSAVKSIFCDFLDFVRCSSFGSRDIGIQRREPGAGHPVRPAPGFQTPAQEVEVLCLLAFVQVSVEAVQRIPASVAVRADDFATGPGTQRPPDVPADRILDELDASVSKERIDSTRMGAVRTVDKTVVRIIRGVAIEGTATPERVLRIVGSLDRVEQ